MNTITVWHNRQGLIISKEVADIIGVSDGYRIKTDDEFWQILGLNASHMIGRINLIKPIHDNDNQKLN